MVKFSLLMPYPAPEPIERIFRLVERVEKYPFDSIWFPDHTLMYPKGFCPDVWTVISALSTKTKLRMGSAVTCPHRRHPSIFAQMIATIDHLSAGISVGIGAGESMNLDPFGIEWRKPVKKMREFIEVCRLLWGGEKVDYDGEFFKLRGAYLQIRPKRYIPIYIGANGRKTRELTGEIADGWIPICESPKTYKKNAEEVISSARKAKRDKPEMALQIYTAISDREEDLNFVRMYPVVMLLGSLKKIREAGYDVDIDEIGDEFYFKELIPGESMENKLYELIPKIPVEVSNDFSIMGNREECIEKIEAFIKAGVEHFILINIGPDPKETLRIYGEEIVPYFRELRD
ncbi:Coenzyme F420-dependent N5,N10-methylene tetrahydromethanopterin reductase-related flavin-dependent oxidoreductase [Archaeoglobus sulfaticallidus PM70-1]|uniref:Coenzyme F420-dependent N5,N10-methylene tetrahydromethanopterin reductase-related flavin-dependent oxidoreductase n=1 Tax=Archaeoglobus sulfaticallidus PM70-1 TaxID=387631 RepID=N0BP38_9EURY|nr:LLM class flavin-dependent oxidoreductase [Archaeoglobus sulfaticallidus]AGK62110.1 Coenzyme F420-dependent N5,N10-methylene tetrahydromethanopterin reductase-related flavin-dependent oxidoreductase [Archaeoglobus sulfaticallidus PM70-1]